MPTVEFPRMGTITQAAAESGVPAYRVRQLCKTGQVRSVRCGRKLRGCRATQSRRSNPVSAGWGYEQKKPPSVLQHARRQGWRKASKPISTPILSF